MGQRTAILVKRNLGNGKSIIDLIHHQWGIGKTMPLLFLQEFLKLDYNLDRSKHYSYYDSQNIIPISQEFTFEPLSNKEHNYIYHKEVNTDEVDVFNIETIKNFFERTDNNNGGMIIEVTQRYEKDGSVACYGVCDTCKIAFVLGIEEEDIYINHKEFHVEDEFSRLCSAREYMERTGGERYCPNEFITSFETMISYFGVEQIFNEEKAEEVKKKIEEIKNGVGV